MGSKSSKEKYEKKQEMIIEKDCAGILYNLLNNRTAFKNRQRINRMKSENNTLIIFS